MITSAEIRKKYLEFFKEKGHAIIPSASLVPENDPSVLFTTAGMHPLVPYLLGEKHPAGARLTDVQKCIRTGDIDEVGDYCHHTFFEMLGNWSLGDPDAANGIGAGYFKEEAIEFSFEFLISPKYLGLDKNRLAVSVFAGDNDALFDSEAFETWKSLGISEKRIAKLPKKNNWWGPAGETGPCGPDTEMFYWVGDPDKVPESFNDDNPLWLEIWNDVFMQYNGIRIVRFYNEDGKLNNEFSESYYADRNLIPEEKIKKLETEYKVVHDIKPLNNLPSKNVDTGMGLERTLAVVNGLDDNYKTDLFWPIIEKIEKMSDKKYEGKNLKAMRIIADHLKASTFILGDEKGIAPSNTGQGYVLRRLIRRAVRYGKQLGMKSFTKEIAEVVVKMYKDVYPELLKNKKFVLDNLSQEEEKFEKTLERGLKEFEKVEWMGVPDEMLPENTNRTVAISGHAAKVLPSKVAFNLYQTYGFPIELTEELAKEKGIIINRKEFDKEMSEHQELSRTASAGMFRGGLSDAGEENKKLHTATHLLHQALIDVLDGDIMQKGSNITAERLRFDFNFGRKMTDEEKKKVEDIVNEKISQKLPVRKVIMKKEEAEKTGASHAFGDKYGDEVSIYFIGDSLETAYSKEFCGGPHVENIGVLGHFRITKEEAVSAGTRRIKAVLE